MNYYFENTYVHYITQMDAYSYHLNENHIIITTVVKPLQFNQL